MKFPKVTFVKAVENYKIEVHFNDGTTGIYDVSNLSGKGIFKSWNDQDNFQKVFVDKESGAISWPGNIDLDTLNIYCKIKGISAGQYFHTQSHHATY